MSVITGLDPEFFSGNGEDEWELEDEFEDEWELEDELEDEDEYEDEWELEDELEDEDEYEDEWEDEDEYEGEFQTLGPAAASASLLMEHLGAKAADAQSEAEAEAFLGALVPLAAKALAPAVAKAAPGIVKSVAKVGRRLFRSKKTRRYLRAVPGMVKRTGLDLARQYGRGRPITAQGAARTFARHASKALSSPRQRSRALRRSRLMDQRWHQRQRRRQPYGRSTPCYGQPYGRRTRYYSPRRPRRAARYGQRY